MGPLMSRKSGRGLDGESFLAEKEGKMEVAMRVMKNQRVVFLQERLALLVLELGKALPVEAGPTSTLVLRGPAKAESSGSRSLYLTSTSTAIL